MTTDAEKIVKIDKELRALNNWPFQDKCNEIAELLYCQYKAEENREGGNSEGCGDLMLEWIKSRFWGYIVADHIPVFHSVYDILKAKNHIGQKNCYTYGDIDVGVWIEKVKNPDDKRVIASTRYCSCADDNTHLYILSGFASELYLDFRCRTVWPRQNSRGGYRVAKSDEHPTGWFSWGDDRDIKVPSINTYRKRNFEFGYNDCRDKGHVFTYTKSIVTGPRLDNPHWHEMRIPHALQGLRWHLAALENYEENKCS
jgi:hypothetical protein